MNRPQPRLPLAPSDETLALLRAHVDRVMKEGDEAQRKAVMQALVQEVRVVSRDEIVPMFRVPTNTARRRFVLMTE